MKVMLIKPPIRGFQHEIGRHCPIGLAYLAAALRRSGHDVSLFDCLSFSEDNHVVSPHEYTARDLLKLAQHPRWSHLLHWGASWVRTEAAIREAAPDAIGISCMFTPFYETAYELAVCARRMFPSVKILLGGQHPTVAASHVLTRCAAVDVAVLGEAEATIASILAGMFVPGELEHQEGVAFRCGEGYCTCAHRMPGRIHYQPKVSWNTELETLAWPASDLLDFDRYGGMATLITSRGCPFACTFCTVHAMVGRRFRHRPAVEVVDEIEHYVRDHGIRRFAIEDDNFTFSIPRVEEICHEVLRRELDVEFSLPNGMTVVKLSKELVDLMARAGFRDLFLGLESTDDQRLRKIEKRFTSLRQVSAGYQWFTERGVSAAASLIVGLPGQGAREIAVDIMNLVCRKIRFWCNPFYPIPGSPDHATCAAQGLISEDTDYVLFDQFNFAIGTSHFDRAALYRMWLMTQTIAHWPDYVCEGRTGAGRNDLAGAIARLVEVAQHKRRSVPGAARLECPAEPCGYARRGNGFVISVHSDSCFAAVNNVSDWQQYPEINRYTADVVATALSLYLGRMFSATPLHDGASEGELQFAIAELPDDELFREFVDQLTASAMTALAGSPDAPAGDRIGAAR
jgi:radical SAM superfamily enzyme YgiQ (UPF0313 family)